MTLSKILNAEPAVLVAQGYKMTETTIAKSLVVILVLALAFAFYAHTEQTKAYYACLALSEKLAQQQKQPDGGVRIVSLPYCRI